MVWLCMVLKCAEHESTAQSWTSKVSFMGCFFSCLHQLLLAPGRC